MKTKKKKMMKKRRKMKNRKEGLRRRKKNKPGRAIRCVPAVFLNGNARTDIRTDTPSYRDARTHLKRKPEAMRADGRKYGWTS